MAGIDIIVDTGTEFEDGAAEYNSVARLDDDKFIIAYRDNNDGNKGKVNIGTRVETVVTISEANVITFNDGDTQNVEVRAFSASLFVIIYYDWLDTKTPRLKAGTVSGTTITLGDEYVISTETNSESYIGLSLSTLDNTNFIASYAYRSIYDNEQYVESRVCSISGTVITIGDAQQVDYGDNKGSSVRSVALDGTHYLITYGNYGGSTNLTADNACVGTVDTDTKTISFAAKTQTHGWIGDRSIDKFDSSHFILCGGGVYGDYHMVAIGSIHATTYAITMGSAVSWADQNNGLDSRSVCAMDASHFVVAYHKGATAQTRLGYVKSGYLTGSNNLNWDAEGEIAMDTNLCTNIAICKLTDDYFLVGYKQS